MKLETIRDPFDAAVRGVLTRAAALVVAVGVTQPDERLAHLPVADGPPAPVPDALARAARAVAEARRRFGQPEQVATEAAEDAAFCELCSPAPAFSDAEPVAAWAVVSVTPSPRYGFALSVMALCAKHWTQPDRGPEGGFGGDPLAFADYAAAMADAPVGLIRRLPLVVDMRGAGRRFLTTDYGFGRVEAVTPAAAGIDPMKLA